MDTLKQPKNIHCNGKIYKRGGGGNRQKEASSFKKSTRTAQILKPSEKSIKKELVGLQPEGSSRATVRSQRNHRR